MDKKKAGVLLPTVGIAPGGRPDLVSAMFVLGFWLRKEFRAKTQRLERFIRQEQRKHTGRQMSSGWLTDLPWGVG